MLRKLAASGATAEGMKVSNPSVTWPNHTTLVTGVHPEKHSVLFNGVLTRAGDALSVSVDPKRDKADLVAVPTVYDVLHGKGYRTAGINWPCTRNSGTVHDDFPDSPDTLTHTTPKLVEELVSAGVLKNASNATFSAQSAASRDQVWTAAALHVIRERRPNFMMWHMLVTDGIQHRYGPKTPAAYTSLAQVDAQIADLLRTLEQAGLRDRTTLFITADHGFETATNIIHPNVLLRKNGWLDTNRVVATPPTFKARAQIISEGGTALIYLTDPKLTAKEREKIITALRELPGIAEVIQPDRFSALGYPLPDKNRQMADLVLSAAPGHAFSNRADGNDVVTPVTLESGTPGHHGYLSTNPKMNALFVVAGRGIKRGTKLGTVDNRDVAPTIAHLLGVSLSGADGKVLRDVLE
jgi:arylsulfatase A-like enzyme